MIRSLMSSFRTSIFVIFITFKETIRAIYYHIFTKPKDVTNDIVLITGGGRGIGRKLALAFAELRPKHIIIWGRNETWLKKTKEDICKLNVKSSYYVCDVSDKNVIYEKAREIQESVGDVTILVNNAGSLSGKSIIFLQPYDIESTLKVNTLAHIWTVKAFLPAMIRNGKGHVVCMSSVLGLLGLKGVCDYATTKFASTGLMEGLMLELEDYSGINTTIIHPYQVDNGMFAGMTVRFPKLFPALQEDYVTKETMTAILTNRKQVTLPTYFYMVLFFRSVLPISSMLPVQKFLGLDKVMDKFHWEVPDMAKEGEESSSCDTLVT
ncbi:Short-chain dehydrogenase/reductase 3 [Mactra antiquata]